MISQEEELHWLALKMVPGLGTRRAGILIEKLNTPQAVFRASRSELESHGINGSLAQSIVSGCSFDEAVEQRQKMLDAGAVMISFNDPRYPPLLRRIFDPPMVLFARGVVNLLDSPMFGVVGTRRPTPYGVSVAERLSGDLSRAGLTIVSGMARGIDTAAHRGTLAAGNPTVAVLGCGVDIVYPLENKRMAGEIVDKGLILSEFPMGAVAFPQNFPIRNRIISGMSVGLLVVEGAQYSGSSITAKLAADQGRELFAIPGNITSKMSWGPNLLIKQGAKMVQDWNDVIDDLPSEVRRKLIDDGRNRLLSQGFRDEAATSAAARASLPTVPGAGAAAEINRRICGQLKVETPIHLDQLIDQIDDCSTSELLAGLFELEMLGVVKQLPGKNFVKVW